MADRPSAPRAPDAETEYRGRRWALIFGLVVMGLTSIPYILGFAMQNPGWVFTGFVFGVEDGNSYIAKMLTGAAGEWLFRTPYSIYPQNGVLAFPFYIWLGKLGFAPGLHEQLVVLYHLFRICAGVLAIVATYDFVAIFVKGYRNRQLATALSILGGGLGWVLLLLGEANFLGSYPLEFYSPETFGFLSIYGLPHLALARATLLWGIKFYLQSPESDAASSTRSGIKVGLLWLTTSLAQPLTGLVMGYVVALHLCLSYLKLLWLRLRKRRIDNNLTIPYLKTASIAACFALPYLLYNAYAFSTDPFLQSWTDQNIIQSPHPLHYIFAYGWMLPLALPGAVDIIRKYPWQGWLPVGWFFSFPLLAYLPVNLQRRLVEGVWTALVVLAIVGLEWAAERRTKPIPRQIIWLYFAPIFMSSLLLLSGGVRSALTPREPLFRPNLEISAFQYLSEVVEDNDVVLAAYTTGNPLPAWAPVHMIIGHGPESVGLKELSGQITKFYSQYTADTFRQEYISEHGVDYVFWGPNERQLGSWEPFSNDFLERIYSAGGYEIYLTRQDMQ